MALAEARYPDLPQPVAPVVPLAEQYHAWAGDGTIAITEAAKTIAAISVFIILLHVSETLQCIE